MKFIKLRANGLNNSRHCRELLRPFARSYTFDPFQKLWATTSDNMQQGVQTYSTCNIQQCCVRLHGALDILRFARETDHELMLRNCTMGISTENWFQICPSKQTDKAPPHNTDPISHSEMENNNVYTSSGVKGALGLLVPNLAPRVLSYPSLSLYRDG